ncbi:MAG: GerW family sporulation protein [Gorillibacterium sp.]|nr:GerW family sporulation protein [Gorillibacterium sp.]
MSEHPIQGLMKTAMEQITEMVNVNTIVGDPIETGDGDVIMPISRVNFGFAAGGSNFGNDNDILIGEEAKKAAVSLPFGGGSGGGVSITPIAFLVVGKTGVKIVPLDNQTHLFERLIDSAPQVVDRIQSLFQGATSGAAGGMSGGSNMMGQSRGSIMGQSGGSLMGQAGSCATDIGMTQGASSGGTTNTGGGQFTSSGSTGSGSTTPSTGMGSKGTGYVSSTSGKSTANNSFTNGVTEATVCGTAGLADDSTTNSTK